MGYFSQCWPTALQLLPPNCWQCENWELVYETKAGSCYFPAFCSTAPLQANNNCSTDRPSGQDSSFLPYRPPPPPHFALLPATFLMAHPWLIPWRVLTSTKCLVQLETKLAWRQGDGQGQGQGQGRRVCRKGGQTEAWLLATAQWGHNFRARQLASGARGSERESGQQTECETELESESETGRLSTMPH